MESELEVEESGNKKTRREALTSALRPRITPYLEGYLDNARVSRISEVEVRLK